MGRTLGSEKGDGKSGKAEHDVERSCKRRRVGGRRCRYSKSDEDSEVLNIFRGGGLMYFRLV